jgi:hypothetical protein
MPQLARMLFQPGFDGWIALDGTGKQKELTHGALIRGTDLVVSLPRRRHVLAVLVQD